MKRIGLTKEQAVQDYLHLKKRLGRKPKATEYTERYYSLASLQGLFGRYGWHSLQMAAGEKPRSGPFVTRAMMIRDYQDLMSKLGRRPQAEEYHKACFGAGTVRAKFGAKGWIKIQEAAGVEPLISGNLPSGHLIDDFLDLQKKLGRRPKLIEYTYRCHTPKVLDRVFGKPGWRNLIRSAGKKAMPRHDLITAEHLVQDYRETCRTLKRNASQEDFRRRHGHTAKVLVRVFGKPGFSNLVKAAGRRPVKAKKSME